MSGSNSTGEDHLPYPGLRPFRREEADIFFGREEHIEALLEMLQRKRRFVAVVGLSGCGKSSLVHAGLIPALERGFMIEAGPRDWSVARLRPGREPFEALAAALLDDAASAQERNLGRPYLEAALRRGPLGLVEAVREWPHMKNRNLLILVDQFEELFRFAGQEEAESAKAFVNLLLSSSEQDDVPLYIAITMRIDFLGHCDRFSGLPEAISDGHFLTPRLNRQQCRAAIVGPARDRGAEAEPALVNQVLNELGTGPDDQLPLMQHALMRMWLLGEKRASETEDAGDAIVKLTVDDYESVGGLNEALSIHADEAYLELNDQQQRITGAMFRCLVEGQGDSSTRRPMELGHVARVAAASIEAVKEVVDVFRRPDRSLLMPPPSQPLQESTILDISHESLIRQWDRLGRWVQTEIRSAETYGRLLQTARLWREGRAALWRTPDLEIAEIWRQKQQPNASWAERYGGELDLSLRFLETSADVRDKAQRRRRHRVVAAIAGLAFLAIASLAIAGVMTNLWGDAKVAEHYAKDAAAKEKAQRKRADRSAYSASVAGIQFTSEQSPEETVKQLEKEGVYPTASRDFAWRYFYRIAADGPPTLRRSRRKTDSTLPLEATSVAFSPDGTMLASSYDDGGIVLWDVTKRTPIPEYDDGMWKSYKNSVLCVAISPSPERRTLASAHEDGTVWLYDLDKGCAPLRLKGHTARVRSVAFSPNGATLASASDDLTIRLWDAVSGDEMDMSPLQGHTNWLSCVAYSPDGKTIASASYDTTVRLWNVETGDEKATLRGHIGTVYSLSFSPDGKTLASASEDKTIKLWDVEKCTDLLTFPGHTSPVQAVAFSTDGKTLCSGNYDGSIKLWDVGARKERFALKGHEGAVNFVVCAPKQNTFASAGGDTTIKLWDADTGIEQEELEGYDGSVRSVAVSPPAEPLSPASKERPGMLASAGDGGTIILWEWNRQTGMFLELKQFPSQHGTVRSVAISPDGTTLASAGDDKIVRLWNLMSSTESKAPAREELPGHTERVNWVTFSPDGKMLASASDDKTIILWDPLGTGKALKTLKKHKAGVTCVAFRPTDGTELASASEDATVRLWDWTADKCYRLGESEAPTHDLSALCVAFSSDGNTLASASDDGTIKIWDVAAKIRGWGDADGKLLGTAIGHTGSVTCVAFSPKAKTLVSGSMDQTIRLWDPESGVPRGTLVGHTAGVRTLAFRDEYMLISAGDDKMIRLWAAPQPTSRDDKNIRSWAASTGE